MGHYLLPTSSFGAPWVPDLGDQIKLLTTTVSSSQTLFNNDAYVSASLFGGQAAAYNMTASAGSSALFLASSNLRLANGATLFNSGSTFLGGNLSVSGLSTFSNGVTWTGSGMSMTNASTLTANAGTTISTNSGSIVSLGGVTEHAVKYTTANTNYICDQVVTDRFVLVSSGTVAVTVTLPRATTVGRLITVGDPYGIAATHTISVATQGGDAINGGTSPYVGFTTADDFLTFMADGVNQWWIVSRVLG